MTIARNIVHYRDEHGRYTNRIQLKKVPRLGPKSYQQAVGFLRIPAGENPLDNTDVHPESYGIATKIMADTGIAIADLGTPTATQQLAKVDPSRLHDC